MSSAGFVAFILVKSFRKMRISCILELSRTAGTLSMQNQFLDSMAIAFSLQTLD
jgi:hypothetical protein